MFLMFNLYVLTGIDFKIKTVELGGKKIKLQIWYGHFYYYCLHSDVNNLHMFIMSIHITKLLSACIK